MNRLTPSQIKILQHLLHEEPYERLIEELKMHKGALNDDLRQLVSFGFIHSRLTDDEQHKGWSFDTDYMEDYTYRATAKGLNASK